jgi:hypothetical protein
MKMVCIVNMPGAYAKAEWVKTKKGMTCASSDPALRWMRRKSIEEAKRQLLSQGHTAVWLQAA